MRIIGFFFHSFIPGDKETTLDILRDPTAL